MSDFGTMVTVQRSDGTSMTPTDIARAKRAAKNLVMGPGDRLSDYADYDLRFGGSRSVEGAEGVMVSMTEYMLDDQPRNGGLGDEALIARDRPLAEQFGDELRAILGGDYVVKVCCGFW